MNPGSSPLRHEKAQVLRPGLFSCGRWGAACQRHASSADRAGGETLNPISSPLPQNAEDGVRWNQKKVQWTFFPPNRPTRPSGRGDLEPGFKSPSARKNPGPSTWAFFVRKMGLEPTRRDRHKILSLARLPIPTLPRTKSIISDGRISVNTFCEIFFSCYQISLRSPQDASRSCH